MKKEDIIKAIEARVMRTKKQNFSIWVIGITDNLERRKEEHEGKGQNTKYWQSWKADNEFDARYIEKYFIRKGMKGGTGGGDYPNFIYMF